MGKTHTLFIHRLLAHYFKPNPFNLPEVNHLDGNKLNNALWNLEWTTHADNVRHAYRTHLIRKKGKKVFDTMTENVYMSVQEAALVSNIPYSTLKNYLSGRRTNPTTLKYLEED